MEISEGELRRIESGPPAEAEPAFVVRVFFTADAPANVVARAGQVLTRVIERAEPWPTADEWPDLLPSWFVAKCAPEPRADSVQDGAGRPAWWWRFLMPGERAAVSGESWTLSGWLHFFDPAAGDGGDRSWWWWDAGSDRPDRGWIDVATDGWPFGTGSLYWLIEACGGTDPYC
ncbi:hypothetical protein ACWDLG_19120 [Nonomuraea sp. NPDC003727]